ncbi:amidohydrolase [Sutterella sp.]|uniref:amidohydrolase n=1 Tax=Sutterella sp. TaxID=1981025 RepID=UPI0026DFAFF5|nr:amidohydrolase [Sutterella sp.]MDO5532700.1 amidohydrolase [Sutterella sp.]
MTKEELKARVCEVIRSRFADTRSLADAIYAEPELGYKEVKTSAKVRAAFDELGIGHQDGIAGTGVKARLRGARPGRTVALLGELDAIICRSHPASDPMTGAAHCCGHNVQIANVLAVGAALQITGAMAHLAGDVVLFAVPAEEYVEIEWRRSLKEAGRLRFFSGKQELIARGAFDDIDLALMMHVNPTDRPEGDFQVGASSNGYLAKLVEYRGRAAHAACAPDEGVNALNAAMLGVLGVNALRETFRESDVVRFHPIISSGGDLVNVIPDRVKIESYTRASNVEALERYNSAANRALKAGAAALGAECRIEDFHGCLPLRPDEGFRTILRENARRIFGEEGIYEGEHSAVSTDMGDVSHLMPVVHPWVGCVHGALHGSDYRVASEEVAYVKSPEVLAMTIIDLLWDDGAEADRICRGFRPVFTKESYLKFIDSLTTDSQEEGR